MKTIKNDELSIEEHQEIIDARILANSRSIRSVGSDTGKGPLKCFRRLARNIKEHRSGSRILCKVLIFQLVYFFLYTVLNGVNVHFENFQESYNYTYDIYELIIILWLAIVSLHFMFEAIDDFILAEFKAFSCSMSLLNIYILLRYIIHAKLTWDN